MSSSDLCVAVCSDPRVPYWNLADLDGEFLPYPGVCGDKALLAYAENRAAKGCQPRFLLCPHKDCKAKAEPENVASSLRVAEALRAAGYQAAVIHFLTDEPPMICSWFGLEDVEAKLAGIIDRALDWSYLSVKPARVIAVAHSFSEVPQDGTLRFATGGIVAHGVDLVRKVVAHYGSDLELPVNFAPDIDGRMTCDLAARLRGATLATVTA